jgi:hypothetical protein
MLHTAVTTPKAAPAPAALGVWKYVRDDVITIPTVIFHEAFAK